MQVKLDRSKFGHKRGATADIPHGTKGSGLVLGFSLGLGVTADIPHGTNSQNQSSFML